MANILLLALATVLMLWKPVTSQCPTVCTCSDTEKSVVCAITTKSSFPELPAWTQTLDIKGLMPNDGLITALDRSHLQGAENLTEIRLQKLGVSSLATDTFQDLTQLKRLELAYNDLTSLPSGVFDNLSKLQYLDLSFNGLDSISSADLNMPSLNVLSLQGNSIKLNDSTIFQYLKRLNVLNLNDNYIGDPIPNYTGEFRHLTSVFMSNCSIKTLSSEFVEIVKNVERLELFDNQIVDLPVNFAPNLTNIRELHLDNNLITEIRPNSFAGVEAFIVTLTDNKISTIESDAFHSFTTETLFLHRNRIANLPPRLFTPLGPVLKNLNLNDNPIVSLPDEAFYNLTGLAKLRLRRAQIKEISPNAFKETSIDELDLRENNLTSISSETLQTWSGFTIVKLSGNDWNCTEELVPLRRWLVSTNQICEEQSEMNCLRCANPEKFRGRLVVNLTETELITAMDPDTTLAPTTKEPTTPEPTTPEPSTPEPSTAEPTVSTPKVTPSNVVDVAGPDIMLYIYISIAVIALLLCLVFCCLVIKTCYTCREVTYPLARKELENGYIPETGEKADDSVQLEHIFTIDGHTNPGFKMNDEELGVSTTSLSTYNTFRPGRGEPCRDSGIVGDSPGSNQSINRPIQAWEEGRTLGYENRTYSNLDEYT